MRALRLGLVVENDVPFVVEEARALRELGVDVRVASVFRPHPRPRWEARFAGPVIYPAPGLGGWGPALLPAARLRPSALAALAIRARREGAPARLVALAAALAARARREGWDHLHASFATQPAFVAGAAAALCGRPFSFTGHAYDVQEPRPWLPRLLAEARFVRAISREGAARLRALAPDAAAARVRVGHLGVDESYFAPASGAGRAPAADPPRIVAVAHLGPTKGLDVLVEAAARLRAGGRDLRVDILGEGPWRTRLEAQVASLGLAGVVRLRGAAERGAVAAALREASLFALPCVALGRPPAGRHDGLPVAILEAMASGLAVVSTPVGGIEDALRHGVSGWLVPPRDAEALALALGRLLDDRPLRVRLGRAARRAVLAHFRRADAAARLAGWIAESGVGAGHVRPGGAPGARRGQAAPCGSRAA